jgi:hypothetical protein
MYRYIIIYLHGAAIYSRKYAHYTSLHHLIYMFVCVWYVFYIYIYLDMFVYIYTYYYYTETCYIIMYMYQSIIALIKYV